MIATAEDGERMRSVSLDALALIGCAIAGRGDDGQALLDTYTDPNERNELFAALLAHACEAIKALAMQAGVSPEKALGGIFACIRAL